ncbi:beta-ketoacyl synthase N-terminal-like domain-containing protein [Paucibacter sp. R3-3]|uniref:Beta-ketoacyl synthase N-terminal-like domain-containing protein n=1 Tax=Roseateles agri TaxID=3098619 RepID=A0ABU5DAH7_9BURK|nr:beta-ketoacyl synthase N-terminal-like domain-containing protein [Paucibacter sp. R3-3]MDY0743287.1 beta-ketoacyl synthase N-terminal-like domain-containing protein [Paucibacter sp. R3-3]
MGPEHDQRAFVVGVGAVTAVGLSAASTAAAVRAGLNGFGQHAFAVDSAGQAFTVARCPFGDPDRAPAERIRELACGALQEALEGVASIRGRGVRAPVFLGVGQSRPGCSVERPMLESAFEQVVSDGGLRAAGVRLVQAGNAAGAMALLEAWQAILSGTEELVVAGAVDSYLEPETLEWLEQRDQVHSAGSHNNPYGFVPGEGAAFVALVSADAAQRWGLSDSMEIVAGSLAREPHGLGSTQVCTGVGLTTLFRQLASRLDGSRADCLWTDMNGEPYRADDFGFASIRAGGWLADPSAFVTPADCCGDVGAASGPLYVVLAEAACRKAYATGPLHVVYTSSEAGERCGFVLRGAMPKAR